MDPADAMIGQTVDLRASRYADAEARNAYARMLADAMDGDGILFARIGYVEEAWCIADPVLDTNTQVYEYEPDTLGTEAGRSSVASGWLAHPRRCG